MAGRSESELYLPVKMFLEDQGYTVRAEVNGCDIVAARGDDFLIVELKSAFNLALVLQGIDRQTVNDNVFLAVEAPRRKHLATYRRDVRRLCGRLGLGLLYVHFASSGEPQVEVVCEPNVAGIRRNKRKKSLLLQEYGRRSGDYNVGGTARRSGKTTRPTVTVYRQDALRIARYIQQQGSASPSELRTRLGIAKAGSILQKNYYGWFVRVKHGVYALSATGAVDMQKYADVVTEPINAVPAASDAATDAVDFPKARDTKENNDAAPSCD
jgi:hypothetical protein